MASSIGVKIGVEGEKAFKNAMTNINLQLKASKSELGALSAQYADNEKSLEALTATQEALKKQLKIAQDAVGTYEEALANAVKTYKEGSNEALKWEKQLNDAKAIVAQTEKAIRDNDSAMEALNSETDEATKSEAELKAETEKAAKELEEKNKKLKEAKEKLGEYAKAAEEKAAKALKALSAAAAGAVTAVSALVLKAGSAADELSDMSKVTGLTTTQLQKYRYTANMAGTSLETITGAQTKLTKQMAAAKDETSAAAKRFADLGVSVQDASGHLRNSDDVFVDVIDALGRIDNEAERDAAAMDIFGKSAKDLNPLILEGADGLREYAKQAEELGIIVSEDNVAALADMQGKVKEITAQFDALKQNLAAKFAPIAKEVLEKVQKVIQTVAKQLDSPKFKASIDKLGEALKKFLDKAAELALKVLPKLVTVATFLLENFDKIAISLGVVWGILKGVSVIQGAIKAFEAVKTTLTGLKASLAATTTAIEGANTAMSASSTVSAGWIGVLLAAAAALSVAVISVTNGWEELYQKGTSNIQDLKEELSELEEKSADATKEYESAFDTSARVSEKAKEYAKRLQELESQTELTNDEQREYNDLVQKLNTAIPDLNLEIDKQTGKLKGGTKALNEQITAWEKRIKLQAIEKRLTALYEEQLDLQIAMDKAGEDYLKRQEAWFAIHEKHNNLITQNDIDEYVALLHQFGVRNIEEFDRAFKETKENFDTAKELYSQNVSMTDELIDKYEEASDGLTVFSSAVGSSGEAVEGGTDAIKKNNEALAEHAQKLKELRENHYKKMESAVTDMFNKINDKTELSMDEIVDTLKHNRDALLQYEKNMRIIAERGASQAALEYLDSLGVEQAGVIDLIAKSTNKEFDAFLSTFDGNIEEARKSAVKWGREVGEGIAGGMKDKELVVLKAAKNLAHMAEKGFTMTLEINSPSRVFYRDTLNVGRAVELSLRDSAAEVEKASGYLARSLESGFDPSVAAPLAYAPRASGAAVSPAISGSGNVYNYYISDPSPAYMDMIMANVDARFGGLYA